MRIYTLLNKLITKIDLMYNYTLIFYRRIAYKYVPSSTITYPSGFAANSSYGSYINFFGGHFIQIIASKKSSAWGTGNITNTIMVNEVINVNSTSEIGKPFASVKYVGPRPSINAYINGLVSMHSEANEGQGYLSRAISVNVVDSTTNSSAQTLRYANHTYVTYDSVFPSSS